MMPIVIETDDYRTKLKPGDYLAKTKAVVYLSQGTGDQRRDVEYTEHNPGDKFTIPQTTGGHWYGLEPNGNMFAQRIAAVELAN
jgi:hypothetical protein